MVSNTVLLVVSVLSIYLLWNITTILAKAFLSPLNIIPGPWYAQFTGLPGVVANLSRRQVHYHHELHQRFGPFVRVSPNEVFVSNIEAYKTIHRVGGHFKKADYYHYFGVTEAGKPPYGLFQMTDTVDHARRRKLLGRGFTTTSLRNEWEDVVCDKVTATIHGMRNDAKNSNGLVNIRKWWMLMASDVISRLMFGESFDGLTKGKEDPWLDAVKVASVASFSALSFPWPYALFSRLPGIRHQRFFQAHKELFDKGQAAVSNSKQTSETKNLFAKVLAQTEKGEKPLSDDDICVEAGSFMIAGTDTTANTLTYLIWAVLSNETLQDSLESETARLDEPFTDAQLEKLPVLHAVIRESLRLYGAAPTPLPRVVPPGGIELGGYYIPGGTHVATQSWTMHRDPEIFQDPEIFDHTRWLPTGSCFSSEVANAAFTPFGAGSRGCIGKQLAYMELRHGAAAFFREFRGARLAPSATVESMDMDSLMLIEPRGKVCEVILPGI